MHKEEYKPDKIKHCITEKPLNTLNQTFTSVGNDIFEGYIDFLNAVYNLCLQCFSFLFQVISRLFSP